MSAGDQPGPAMLSRIFWSETKHKALYFQDPSKADSFFPLSLPKAGNSVSGLSFSRLSLSLGSLSLSALFLSRLFLSLSSKA